MRQFAATFLFRATAIDERSFDRKHRTFYLIAETPKEAKNDATRQLKTGEVLGKTAMLGKQYGDYFFKD
jgi:hypothetical protein